MSPVKEVRVKKRDGTLEPLNIDKIHQVVQYACEGLSKVSASEIELRSQLHFYDGIKTSDIQETLIRAAHDLISEETPDYQYVAGRLVSYAIRKEVFGRFEPISLLEHITRVVEAGFYDAELLTAYTEEEIWAIDSFIDHARDEQYTYAGMEQWRTKYLVRNRFTGKIFETPQFAYAAMGMIAFAREEDRRTRMEMIERFIDATQRISLPTPIMAGLRTPQKQFSSCVLIETDDSLDSINATSSAIVKYVSQKAGIGIGAGRIRGVGSPIRNGDATHTGIIPFLKHFYSAVASCSQGGVRKGSATAYYPLWHIEVEDLLVLKNNKGTEETRIRHMDFGVQINKLLYQRLISGGNITLFSPNDVPGLYDAFFADQQKFQELYEAAERNKNVRKKVVPATLFAQFISERKDTGRLYVQHVDHANDHSPFKADVAPIRMSNLCVEIDLPTVPLNDISDPNGQIALCTLAAMAFSQYSSPAKMRGDARLLVRFLDNILSYQSYPVKAAETSTRLYRPLGIGVTDFAHWMAKHDLSFANPTDEDLLTIATWMDHWSYYLIEASVDLAEERGPCEGWQNLKYVDGIAPWQTAVPEMLNRVISAIDKDRWQSLMERAKVVGIRNATTMAGMPCETSALIANHSNGFEPIRAFVTSKKNKDMVVKQVAPGFPQLRKRYEPNMLWNMESPVGYLTVTAVAQVFMDQGISINTSYNPKFFPNDEIPVSTLLQHQLIAYKLGHKQLYYFNTNDQAGEVDVVDRPLVSSPASVEEDDCSSCKL